MEPMSTRELRKQVLLARIALQRVELQQELGLLRERVTLPTIAKQVMRSTKLTSALLGVGVALFKRFAGSRRMAERAHRRGPRSHMAFKVFGVVMALWPVIKFGREGYQYIRARQAGGGWRR